MITAKVVNVQTDVNGNIQVQTEYKKDGVLVQTGATRYSFGVSPDIEDVKKKINEDVNIHCKNLIAREYVKNTNAVKVHDIAKDVVGLEYSAESAIINIADKELTVNETTVLASKDVTPVIGE